MWCEHHRNDPVPSSEDEAEAKKRTTEIDDWDAKYMQVDQEMLFEVILVRNLGLATLQIESNISGRQLHGY